MNPERLDARQIARISSPEKALEATSSGKSLDPYR